MGIDAGFDMVPRLSKGVVDRHTWDQFISVIKDHYKDDTQVEIKPNYIVFKAGEHPMLPFEGHKFLRFSSKISGAITAATGVESYIDAVTLIAKQCFGSRIQYWNECAGQHGKHDWNEVRESIRSYEQPDDDGTSPLNEQVGIPLFEIMDLPGKGRGLVACFNISEGTRILCEKPLLTARSMPLGDELELILAAELKALPKASQRQFLSLHNDRPEKYPFSHTFKKNALPCGSGSSMGGVYPTACLINHSCIPNSHNSWNSITGHETIHAIRRIKAGEEITISYDRGGPSSVRQAFLKNAFCFDCKCIGCSLPASELQASNTRRLLIQSLDDSIGNPFRVKNRPKESLRDCHLLLQVLKEEYDGCVGILNGRLYYDAFQVSIMHGDQARASVFAGRAYKVRVICEGEDSPDTQKVKSLALKPAGSSCFELYSVKWKTALEAVPKGLDAAQFEKWLFRE